MAVLSALALMAGMLAAAPVAADEDPRMDYTATFDACEGVEASGFEDVPDSHSSAGSIDCIAYYGITKGTSATTYSPTMSVTREHMALFLTRLAGLVGIDIASNPADAGFEDIGDLTAESQTAINQLADLGITQGTSAATYSPADAVRRGHMALFIARLMNHIDPMANGDFAYGFTPEDVVDNDMDDDDDSNDKVVGSPFTDLQSSTKEAFDAITALWELGVASGISDTSYAPDASITRAAMADFMAGVLDHSNARPAGVTMQVTKTTDFGAVMATRVISARDDSFAPMADVSVKVFTDTDSGGFDDDGKCRMASDCEWSDNAEITNDDGNDFDTIRVVTDDGNGGSGNMEDSETWYAWMGDEENPDFVKGSSGEAMVTLTAKANALGIRVTSDINENAGDQKVDVGEDRTVVITAQLIDTVADGDDSKAVAKEGVELAIARTRGTKPEFPAPDPMKTDADGKVTFTIMGPEEDDADVPRDDMVTFTGDTDGDADTSDVTGEINVMWSNEKAAVAKGMAKTNASYVIIDDDGEVRIMVTVSYYDQYGNPAGSNHRLTITIDNIDDGDDTGEASSGENLARVRSNGTARFSATMEADPGDTFEVEVSDLGTVDDQGQFTALTPALEVGDLTADNDGAVLAVQHADKDNDGVTAVPSIVDTDNDRFIIDTGGDADTGTSGTAGVLYSYDSGDTFIVKDAEVDMEEFEEAIGMDGMKVTVVFYSTDGTSIFSVEGAE